MPTNMRTNLTTTPLELVVCEGDETGQELLDEALRVLAPSVVGVEIELQRFDLSLANRRRTANAVVHEAAEAMRAAGFGLKAATITSEGADDVGSPNPIAVVRMAVGDAYGAEEWRAGMPGGADESAGRTERITRSSCRAVAEHAFRLAASMTGEVYGGPKWTVSARYEALLKEEMDAAAARHPEVGYHPVLIDAAYAGLLTASGDGPLVIPALNRDGDCLSDLVLVLFGSIAGAESVLLAFDADLAATVVMAEAPHGTAPSLAGKNLANPMAMLLACAAVLDYVATRRDPRFADVGRAVRDATLLVAAAGIRTFDVGGEASTSEVVDAVVAHVQAARSAC